MASGTIIVTPHNGANIIQTAPGFPSVPLQAPGSIPYPQYGAQQLGIPTNAPQQKSPLERFFNAEPKVLGAVQIMIGLIHIGFGALSVCSFLVSYIFIPLTEIGCYPFWGGIFFISSGSLCVVAVKRPSRDLMKTSVGLNITSAIMALFGIILYICEISLSRLWIYENQHNIFFVPRENTESISFGLSGVLLLFSLLEFCIAVSLAYLGCQATCCSDDQPTVLYVPYQVIGDGEVAAEPDHPTPPPTYDNGITKSQ
ncbi:membrane-spanning 4-domains subfamily A member 8-like [Erythrolamprus reginae]|uniref:membrane-spanning 4-domains subfamily A member 8-like n=1 Tax=Erythrolamprus reginae TaxID=121349 RepID=UPI00396C7C01